MELSGYSCHNIYNKNGLVDTLDLQIAFFPGSPGIFYGTNNKQTNKQTVVILCASLLVASGLQRVPPKVAKWVPPKGAVIGWTELVSPTADVELIHVFCRFID